MTMTDQEIREAVEHHLEEEQRIREDIQAMLAVHEANARREIVTACVQRVYGYVTQALVTQAMRVYDAIYDKKR